MELLDVLLTKTKGDRGHGTEGLAELVGTRVWGGHRREGPGGVTGPGRTKGKGRAQNILKPALAQPAVLGRQ